VNTSSADANNLSKRGSLIQLAVHVLTLQDLQSNAAVLLTSCGTMHLLMVCWKAL
jgi:hypothetical protein